MKLQYKFVRKYILFAVMALLYVLPLTIKAQQISPKYETRAVWVTTLNGLDWPKKTAGSPSGILRQKNEFCELLDKLKNGGVNTVILQTRVRATTIYPSQYEPWDVALTKQTGKNPGYDPLRFAIEECHKRGMELHAWVVTIPIGKWNSHGCKELRKKKPNLVIRIGDEGYMNPTKEETGTYIARICSEIVNNYDVDGIHLDYIRYPETWKQKINGVQGRANITKIVGKINKAVKQNKPWVKLTCAPIGKHDDLRRYSSRGWNARSRVCQDAQEWLRTGLMDGLYPMMYFQGNNFFPFALDWIENSYGKPVISGLGIYFMRDKNWSLDVIKRQMEVCRLYGLGHAYFRSEFFTDNLKGIYDFASSNFDVNPALPNPMVWQTKTAPSSPRNLVVNRYAGATNLSWEDAKDNSGGNYLLYNIYASDKYPVDIEDARNLVATHVRGKNFTIRHKQYFNKDLHYAVTAINRFGIEGKPSVAPPDIISEQRIKPAPSIRLPQLPNNLDAQFFVIETAEGTIIDTQPYNSAINIQSLPTGMYIIRTLGKKAVMHRIGWLKVSQDKNKQKSAELKMIWRK
jgi:uncharacterized lipoprotein YddW (UPF0748 family)